VSFRRAPVVDATGEARHQSPWRVARATRNSLGRCGSRQRRPNLAASFRDLGQVGRRRRLNVNGVSMISRAERTKRSAP
jgi:hypothetical protein